MARFGFLLLCVLWLAILQAHTTTALDLVGGNYTGTDEQRAKVLSFIEAKLANATARIARREAEERELLRKREVDFPSAIRLRSASAEDVDHARTLVAAAKQQHAAYNKYRVRNPRHNTYKSRHAAESGEAKKAKARDDQGDSPDHDVPQPVINETVAAAAALVAEADAAALAANGTLLGNYSVVDTMLHRTHPSSGSHNPSSENVHRRSTPSSYWLANKEHLGTSPFNSDTTYEVFRNVQDYGAVGDGVTDDTAAINRAITDGNRCGSGCESSSVTGALVFFPPGTYLVSAPIVAYYFTQLVGDPTNVPTILAAPSFVGLGVVSTDVYIDGGNGAEWYIEQSNFYRQIRNLNIDITKTDQTAYICGIHYQVAQATSIQNVGIIALSSTPGNTQQGIYAENGSGGWMSDVVFVGGAFGLYGGNQQFTTRNMMFLYCKTAMQLEWDWGWTWQDLKIYGAGAGSTGISLLGGDGVTRGTGSITLVDAVFDSVETGILVAPLVAGAAEGTTGITLSNVAFQGVTNGIKDSAGAVILDTASTSAFTVSYGNVYDADTNYNLVFSEGFTQAVPRSENLVAPGTAGSLPQNSYYGFSMPQYESLAAGDQLVQAKWLAAGDGTTDDTQAMQALLDVMGTLGTPYVLYLDAGAYVLSSTATVHPGTIVVGEVWPLVVAQAQTASSFQDYLSPTAMFSVGAEGDVGTVQIQQLLFTTNGPTGGLVAVEWNMHADAQGSAAMWDSHVRIGGALGSNMQVAQCPTSVTEDEGAENCMGASLMVHITQDASAYMENCWFWTADHDIDDAANTQINVFVARGMLVESQHATWLYGTAVEHAVLYQYQFQEASEIVAGMIQTESPYFQPTVAMPAPFTDTGTVGQFFGDPVTGDCLVDGSGCDSSWALRIRRSSDITIYGAGLYSWYQDYDEACVGTQNCQSSLVQIDYSFEDVVLFNLVTIGAVNMLHDANYITNQTVPAGANTNGVAYPYWSLVASYRGQQTARLSADVDLAAVQEAFPGFFWDYAFPGGMFGCNRTEQWLILRETVRMANEMVQGTSDDMWYNGWFNRFFIRPDWPGLTYTWQGEWKNSWAYIVYYTNAYRQVMTWKDRKAPSPKYQIALSCYPKVNQYTCRQLKTGASTQTWPLGSDGDWTPKEVISMCPEFWTASYSNDVLKGRVRSVQDLGSRAVIPLTYEQIMIHELGHCYYQMKAPPPPPGQKNGASKIIDPYVRWSSNEYYGARVYGAKITSIFWAWWCATTRDCKSDGYSANRDTATTAESWAWMYQNRFFAKAWGWSDDGSPPTWTANSDTNPDPELYLYGDTDPDDDSDDVIDDYTTPVDITPLCTPNGTDSHGTPSYDCIFPDTDYDGWLLDQGYPCDCDEDGCSITSPACCASGSCPACDCNEDACSDDSPLCCADSTCQWLTTQGPLRLNGPLNGGNSTGNSTGNGTTTATTNGTTRNSTTVSVFFASSFSASSLSTVYRPSKQASSARPSTIRTPTTASAPRSFTTYTSSRTSQTTTPVSKA